MNSASFPTTMASDHVYELIIVMVRSHSLAYLVDGRLLRRRKSNTI